MMTKKPKREILEEIRLTVQSELSYELQNCMGSNNSYQVSNAITKAIEKSFEIMIDNHYSHEDFEKDVGLK